jgi:hypothetical protein
MFGFIISSIEKKGFFAEHDFSIDWQKKEKC